MRVTKKAKLRFVFYIVGSLAVALVISLVIGISFFVSLNKKEDKKEDIEIERYTLSIGLVDTKKTKSRVYGKDIIRDGVMCTDFSRISDECGYTSLVNGDEIRFYFNNDSEDMLVVTVGEDTAYLNGNPVHISTSVYKIGSKIYLPVDFINTYMEGFTVIVDNEKATIIVEYEEPKKCLLKLKYPQTLEPLEKIQ